MFWHAKMLELSKTSTRLFPSYLFQNLYLYGVPYKIKSQLPTLRLHAYNNIIILFISQYYWQEQ